MSVSDERMWGMFAHLAPFVGALIGLPFLGPLVVFALPPPWPVVLSASNMRLCGARMRLKGVLCRWTTPPHDEQTGNRRSCRCAGRWLDRAVKPG
jgi:hypothetical protein